MFLIQEYPHWKAVKHLLRYLKGSSDWCLTYRKSESSEFGLYGFSDSDWANDVDDRRSTSAYCFKLSPNSGVVCWSSRKQPTVALSSCEAEYIAMSSAAQELVFLRGLVCDLGVLPHSKLSDSPHLLYGDNQGAIALATNPIAHKRTKHIDIRHHYLRDLVEQKTLKLQYIPTGENLADILTKNLPKETFVNFRQQLFAV